MTTNLFFRDPYILDFLDLKDTYSEKDLENAIRLFVTLVLFRETDKENKIKLNRKNVFDYLKQPDFWKNEVYKNEKFLENLDKLK